MATKFRRHILSAGEQYARMPVFLPEFTARVRNGVLIAEGPVQPTPLSEVYRVRIEYRGSMAPKVCVLEPTLTTIEKGVKIPHMFEQKHLCLYLPGSGEWTGDMVLAKVIPPWISLWLYYYEMWHATGEWLGGGHDPEDDKAPIRNEAKEASKHERKPKPKG